MNIKCINYDWLEVFALEPVTAPRDADYFRGVGYKVKVRSYGTPQYKEMFTLSADGHDLFEIRRNPYSIKSEGGIFEPNACHIRLCNETCYEVDPVAHLRAFMVTHDYTYKSISRIDIAMDFNTFDNGMQPERLIQQYMRGKVSKVNQVNVSVHGADTWTGRVWQSLRWGSPSSPVSTKLYNKSKEMQQCMDKPYIRQRWQDAGLDLTKDVWRVEFSLSSQMQSLKSLKSGEMFRKSLAFYDSRERLLQQWFILYNKYFDFRKLIVNRKSDGKLTYVRKYRCPRLELFKTDHMEPYVPCRNVTKKKRPERIWKIIMNKLEQLKEDDARSTREERRAASVILAWCGKRMQLSIHQEQMADSIFMAELERVSRASRDEGVPDDTQQEFEMRLLYKLMDKYGISTHYDPTLPF